MATEAQKPAAAAAAQGTGATLKVEVEKDTLTAQNDTIGLAQSYVARTLLAAADDIADIVVRATNEREVELLVATAPGSRGDADLAVAMRLQVQELSGRLDDALPRSGPTDEESGAGGGSRTLDVVSLAGGLLQALPSAAETVTKLLAHQYTTAGTVLDTVNGGLDLRVAGSIRNKLPDNSSMSVLVERLWTPTQSQLLSDIGELVRRHGELQVAVGFAEAAVDGTRAALDAVVSARAAAQNQLVELSKGLDADKVPADGSAWRIAWDYATQHADADLSERTQAHDSATSRFSHLSALQSALEKFLVSVLTPAESGVLPLVASMRGEWLRASSDTQRMIVYVHALHGGVDQVLDTKLGPDKRVVLAGSGVEFALIGTDGTIAASGVRDNLWGGVMPLNNLSDFRGSLMDSVFEPNVRRAEPSPAKSTS